MSHQSWSVETYIMDSLWIAQCTMYCVFLFSIVVYVVLDGFDLGVGCLHLFAKGDRERRMMIHAIAPVWDGNSTWMVVGSAVLFAAFPKAFATLAPNLYTPCMVLLFGLMLRAASIEFRGKGEGVIWSQLCDIGFWFSSVVLTAIMGLIVGNAIQGFSINNLGELEGGFQALCTPYPIVITIFGFSCCTLHGALYLLIKTEGEFHLCVKRWVDRIAWIFVWVWTISISITLCLYPHIREPFLQRPGFLLIPLLSCIVIYMMMYCLKHHLDGYAFLCSCLSIVLLFLLFVIATFPNIVYSTIHPEQNSLTFMNSSVSETALWILCGISLGGIALSVLYFVYLYRVFKGKITLESLSY